MLELVHGKLVDGDLSGHTLFCKGEVDVYTSPRLSEMANQCLDDLQYQVLEIDLCDVSYIDSTGLGAIISICKRSLEKTGRLDRFRIRIGTQNHQVRKVFRITGLDKTFYLDDPVVGKFSHEEAARPR